MKTDRYTKIVLTLIAVGLWVNVGISLIADAHAYGSGENVKVTNLETDVRGGETLYVHVTNLK